MLFVTLLFVGCSRNSESELLEINKKLEANGNLTPKEGCIVDIVVSSVSDKNNFQIYAATFEVLTKAFTGLPRVY